MLTLSPRAHAGPKRATLKYVAARNGNLFCDVLLLGNSQHRSFGPDGQAV